MTDHTCTRHPEPAPGCYTGCRCRCPRCTVAINVYKQQLKSRHAHGVVSVPRDEVRTHLRRLLAIGATAQGVARAAGVRPLSVRSVLDETKTRPVPVATARKLLAVTPRDLPGNALVSSGFARDLIGQLRAAGLSNNAIARGLGWTTWPGASWPRERVQVRLVVALRELLDEVTAPRCVDCDRPALAGGLRCLPCFTATADPRSAPSFDPRCGTERGYQRHWRAGEKPCERCREAHATPRTRTAVAS